MKNKIICLILVVIGIGLITIAHFRDQNIEKSLTEEEQTEVVEEVPQEEVIEEEVIEEEPIIKESPFIEANIEEYHNDLESIAKDSSVYGLSVVVYKDNEVLDLYNYGFADKDTQEEINDNTVFRVASVSKTISNILIMKLVDEGKLNLNDNLKEITGLDYPADVKLVNLLTHTSGLKDTALFNENMDKVLDINTLLKDAKTKNEAGQAYIYSNFAAGTMAAIVEKVTGQRFYEYADEVLFKPLGLNAGYLYELLEEGTPVAKMYEGETYDPATWIYNKEFYDQFKIGEQYRLAYGNLYSSSSDLAKLAMVLSGDGTYNGIEVLSKKSLREIRAIRNEADGYPYVTGLNTDLFENLVEGRNIYGHTGSAYGAITSLMYDPTDNTGVVILSNHASSKKNDLKYNEFIYNAVNLVYKDFFTYK